MCQSAEDKFTDKEEKQMFSGMLKFFISFFILAIIGFIYNYFRELIVSIFLLNLLFSVLVFVYIIYAAKFFYEQYRLDRTGWEKIKKAADVCAIKIEFMQYQNPLFFKYQTVLNAIGGIIFSSIVFFIVYKTLVSTAVMSALIVILFVNLSFALYEALTKITVTIGEENLVIAQRQFLKERYQSIEWKKILPYFKKIEYRKDHKGVVIYTSFPVGSHDDSFSPIKWVFGYYANFFIPVAGNEEASRIIEFVINKRNSLGVSG